MASWYQRVENGLLYLPALAVVIGFGAWLYTRYRRTLGRRRDRYSRLGRLGTNAHLSFFASVIGEPPAISRHFRASVTVLDPAGQRSQEEEREFFESIFIDRDFYVQAISEDDGSVITFSVTTRSKRFRPRLISPGATVTERGWIGRHLHRSAFAPTFDVRLARSHFAALPPPQRAGAWVGARRWHYYEAHWLGNPGNYQWYVFSVNQAGADAAAVPLIGSLLPEGGSWDFDWSDMGNDAPFDKMTGWHRYRAQAQPNTYTVIGPTSSFDDYPLGRAFGVDVDHVRTLP